MYNDVRGDILQSNPNKALWTLSIAQFFVMQSWFVYSSILPIIQTDWNLTSFESGFILSFFHLGYVVAVFFFSFLTDKMNPKRLFLFGSLLAGIASLLFALLANGFWTALIFRTLGGIGVAGIYVPGMKLVAHLYPPDKRGNALGIYVGSLVAGSGFSLFTASLFLNWIGWKGVFLLVSLSCFIAYAIIMKMQIANSTISNHKLSFALIKKVMKKPNTLVSLGYAGHCWELYAMWAWIGPFLVYYFTNHGYSNPIQLGNLFGSLVIMIGAVATIVGGKLSDRIGRIPTIQLFITLSIICSLGIGWITHLPIWIFLLVVFIYGFVIIADSPIYNTTVTELTDEEHVGLTLGIQSVLGFSFTVMSPMFFGFILEDYGWSLAFTLLGLLTLLTPVTMIMLKRLVKV